MKTMSEELMIQKIDFLIEKVNEIKEDSKEIKSDINDIKVKQENLATNIAWIKVLFPIAFTLIILLLGVLIKLAI
jgi:hypothetical protein